ncbi:MAG: class I SAM-dependent methyltransferase [Bacteroidetes bacterium]|nr:class I SAM-dependent methyltransferase [Bacteroidota bacterium]
MNIKNTLKLFLPKYQKLILEYKVDLKPRYGYGLKPHKQLYDIVNAQRSNYAQFITSILKYKKIFDQIKPEQKDVDETEPYWNNGFFPGLDVVSLYTFLAEYKPKKYIEIGSGNSTKVARKSINENKLATEITSIDPYPRASIDKLADKVIRMPLEKMSDYSEIINYLEKNDILFIDNSHRCLPNSDATVCFLELLPQLKPGVIVHIHDIYIPYDYPQNMCDRFYSEQYVLAAFLLANPKKYEVMFPGIFVSEDKELANSLESLWQSTNTKNAERHGGSFWFKIN